MSSNCSELGFLFFPYNEIIGSCVFSSMLLLMCAPSSTVPRNPCSGVKIFFTLTFVLIRVSMRCVLLKMLVWLATTAMSFPSKRGRYNSNLDAPTIASSAFMMFFLE